VDAGEQAEGRPMARTASSLVISLSVVARLVLPGLALI
jgi:hypothetical protein